jgi:hypothetical protein
MENRGALPPEDISNLRKALMDGSINLHQHSSRKANVGETTMRNDDSMHSASDKVSDFRACKLILDSFWAGKDVQLSSFEASHVKAQIDVIKSQEIKNVFSDVSSYLHFIAWYLKITDRVNDPDENVRHHPGKVIDKSMFSDILDTDEGRAAFQNVESEFLCLADSLEKLIEVEANVNEKILEAQEIQVAEEIKSSPLQTEQDAKLAHLKEILRIRLENGESNV